MHPLIIERPDLQTRLQRYGYLSVTFIGWVLWLYLFVPLLSLAAWVFGATLVYQTLLQGLSPADLAGLLVRYGGGIAVLVSALFVWAMTSYWRFRGMDRRRAPPPVDDERLRHAHHLDAEELAALRKAGRLVVSAEQLERMFTQEGFVEATTEPARPREAA
jgi:biofilm PGA synthesis protein PgaD